MSRTQPKLDLSKLKLLTANALRRTDEDNDHNGDIGGFSNRPIM
jgi:hypothetical protein